MRFCFYSKRIYLCHAGVGVEVSLRCFWCPVEALVSVSCRHPCRYRNGVGLPIHTNTPAHPVGWGFVEVAQLHRKPIRKHDILGGFRQFSPPSNGFYCVKKLTPFCRCILLNYKPITPALLTINYSRQNLKYRRMTVWCVNFSCIFRFFILDYTIYNR